MSLVEFRSNPNVQEELSIEYLLEEAMSFGLRNEVQETARKIREEMPGINLLTAYELAFNEWVK